MLRPYFPGPLGLGADPPEPVAQPGLELLRFVTELQGLADLTDV